MFFIWGWIKTLSPFCSHQNSWVKMDVHPPKNGMYRYWSIAICSSYVLHMFPTVAMLPPLCPHVPNGRPHQGPDLAPGPRSPDHDPAWGHGLLSLDAHGYINNTWRWYHILPKKSSLKLDIIDNTFYIIKWCSMVISTLDSLWMLLHHPQKMPKTIKNLQESFDSHSSRKCHLFFETSIWWFPEIVLAPNHPFWLDCPWNKPTIFWDTLWWTNIAIGNHHF